MQFLADVLAWLTAPSQWSGRDSIPVHLAGHLELSAAALLLAAAIALPIGLAIGHTGRFAFTAVALANVGRATPSLAILGLAFIGSLALGTGLGFVPTLVALTALAIPPMVTVTHAALLAVDRELLDAGRGLGMSEIGLLARVELPLALPVIVGGARTAAVQVVATATLGAVVSADCLGFFILQGIALNDPARTFGAAVLVAVLALATEGLFALLQRAARPAG